MAKQKRKLTKAEKAAKALRKAEFEYVFLNGNRRECGVLLRSRE